MHRSHLLFGSLVLFLAFAVTPSVEAANRGLSLTGPGSLSDQALGAYHALIVGIDDYREWNPLQTAVKDAAALRDTLVEQYGFDEKNVTLRTDRGATRLRIIQDLRGLASSLGETDNLLIYFAGHGQLDDLTGDGYWIPSEGGLKNPGTWLSHATLKGILGSEKLRAKNVVVIADSCYSGTLLRGGPSLLSVEDRAYREKLAEAASRRSRQVITSGGLEPVADGGRDGHSLFAYYLLTALRENEREVVDLENLFHTRVWEPVTQIGGQRPNVGRLKTAMDEDGQFVLRNEGIAARRSAQAAAEEERRRAAAAERARLEAEQARLEAELHRLDAERRLLEEQRKLEAERLNLEREKQQLALEAVRRKLEQEEIYVPVTPPQSRKKAQVVSLPPSNPLKRPVSRPLTVALLPWDFRGLHSSQIPLRFSAATLSDQVGDELFEDRAFRLTHSFYPWDGAGMGGTVQEIPLSSKEAEAVWVKDGLFSKPKPDVKRVAAIGKRLGVDLVYMVIAAGDNMGRGVQCTAFLIETATRRLFESSLRNIEFTTFESVFLEETRNNFQRYLREAGEP